MERTKFTRKMDSVGRIMVPIRLREETGIVCGKEYDFFVHLTSEGRKFVCIECPLTTEEQIQEATKLLRSKGIKVGE